MELAFDGENFSVGIVSHQVRSVWQSFEVVLRPTIVLCVPITPKGQLVLIRQFRVAVREVVLELPAGRVADGEEPEHAMRRELLEEAGFRAGTIHKVGTFLTAPHFSNERAHVFIAEGKISSPRYPTPKEDLREVVEVTPQDLNEMIVEGRMLDSKSIAAIAIARNHGTRFGVTL